MFYVYAIFVKKNYKAENASMVAPSQEGKKLKIIEPNCLNYSKN